MPVVFAFEQGGLGDPVSSWHCRSQNVEWPQRAEVLMVGPIVVSIVGAVVAAIVARGGDGRAVFPIGVWFGFPAPPLEVTACVGLLVVAYLFAPSW